MRRRPGPTATRPRAALRRGAGALSLSVSVPHVVDRFPAPVLLLLPHAEVLAGLLDRLAVGSLEGVLVGARGEAEVAVDLSVRRLPRDRERRIGEIRRPHLPGRGLADRRRLV